MAITRVQMFKASDGKPFESREAAEAYDRAIVNVTALRTIFQNPRLTPVNQLICPDLFSQPEIMIELRDALTKSIDYHYRYGKLKGKPRPK